MKIVSKFNIKYSAPPGVTFIVYIDDKCLLDPTKYHERIAIENDGERKCIQSTKEILIIIKIFSNILARI